MPRAVQRDPRVTPGTAGHRVAVPAPRRADQSGSAQRPLPPVRRGSAEPLRASWDPPPPRVARGRRRDLLAAHGWRVYAIPVLVVFSVLAVVHSARPGASDVRLAPGRASGPTSGAPPIVTEAPGAGREVNVPSAELPPGGEFPVTGAHTWHVVPGGSPPYGAGQPFTYTVELEDGVSLVDGDAGFAMAVDATLDDPRSWIGSGTIEVQRVDSGAASFRVSLTSQQTTRELCGYQIRYDASCFLPDSGRVLINAARWVRGAAAFDGQLGLYRQYAINHEVGHAFRNQHVPCPAQDALAPVMMQQSFGVANDYLAQLTDTNPQGGQIRHDGLVCKPNAWPFPRGGSPTG